jgi:histidine triad (HIT) family protein
MVRCVFCQILAGRSPAHRIAENEQAVAILDIHPWAAGHTLVISRRHVPFFHRLTSAEASGLFDLAYRVARRLAKSFDPEFICLIARGRRIPHTHLFLVPTRAGEPLDRFFNGLRKIQEGSEELTPLHTHSSRAAAASRIGRVRTRARRRSGRSRRRGAGR